MDIPWLVLLSFCSVLAIPLTINHVYHLNLGKEIAVSTLRMGIQLLLVGFYLQTLFTLNSVWINLLWIVVMIVVGASSVVGKANLPQKSVLMPATLGLGCGMLPVLSIVIVFVIHPSPLYNAQYVIPLAGMLLGNSISGNIVSLQNLFRDLEERRSEYEAAIALGASPQYASQLFVRNALKKSFAPLLGSMATMGLVTLPGMMTGQILGGAPPIIAVKYQFLIMIAIFSVLSLSLVITLKAVLRKTFNQQGRILIHFTQSE